MAVSSIQSECRLVFHFLFAAGEAQQIIAKLRCIRRQVLLHPTQESVDITLELPPACL
jgi:hypothetical protein